MRIVGVEEEATWLEVETPNENGRRIFKVLARLGDRTDADAVEVRSVEIRDGDRTRTLEGRALRRSRAGYEQWARLLVANWEGLSQEDVVVSAGTFRGAYRGRHETTFGPFASTGAVWHHPAVPVTGMVRFRGDAGATLELVEFGTEGATSAFAEEAP